MKMTDKKYTFEDYTDIIKELRGEHGCPWDRDQTDVSLKGCMIDEAAEVLAGIDVYHETGDPSNLCEELGDLLLLIVLESQIASEKGIFDIRDVIRMASEKMIRRHPHVFAGAGDVPDWNEIKKKEKESVSAEVESAKARALVRAEDEILELIRINREKRQDSVGNA